MACFSEREVSFRTDGFRVYVAPLGAVSFEEVFGVRVPLKHY